MGKTALSSVLDVQDETLRRRAVRMADAAHDSDWHEVSLRAARLAPTPHRRRRVAILAAVVTALALLVAPALAYRTRILAYVDGPPAPAHVVNAFESFDRGAPPALAPGVDAGEARQIKTFQLGDGKTTTLWVAPTRDGGFCDILAGALVGCRSGADNGSASKYVIGFGITPPRGAMPFTIAGDVAGKSGIERLQIAFQDGDRADIPLTWIGPPIGAAFYLYEVPASERSIGHRPSVLIGMDATGNEVATQPLPTELTKPMPAGG